MADVIVLTKTDWNAFENRLLRKIDEKMKVSKISETKFYTSKELEGVLNAAPNTLKKFRENGLSFIRIGSGEYRYDKNDVLEFLNKNKYNHLADLLGK